MTKYFQQFCLYILQRFSNMYMLHSCYLLTVTDRQRESCPRFPYYCNFSPESAASLTSDSVGTANVDCFTGTGIPFSCKSSLNCRTSSSRLQRQRPCVNHCSDAHRNILKKATAYVIRPRSIWLAVSSRRYGSSISWYLPAALY